jgi:hypothetical protein
MARHPRYQGLTVRKQSRGRPNGGGGRGGTAVKRGGKDRPDGDHALVGPHAPGARQVLDDVDAAAPSEDREACAGRGRVALPPSLTATSVDSPSTLQATRSQEPCSGRAWRIALLSSSLITRTASPMAASRTPTASNSWVRRRRAIATLAGAAGRRTTLDVPTSLRSLPRYPRRLGEGAAMTEMPAPALPETGPARQLRPARPLTARDRAAAAPADTMSHSAGTGDPPVRGSWSMGTTS